MSDEIRDLAKKHGIDLGTKAGRAFAEWLLTRPKVQRSKFAVTILKALRGLLG